MVLPAPGAPTTAMRLAPQLRGRDDVAALAPAGQVAVQGDPEGWGGELVVAGLGDQAGGLAVAGALVDALAAADEGAPLGPAGGPLGVPHRQRRGQQPDRDGQPHLGGDQVPEELADGDAGAGGAEAEVQGHVLPEVLGHKDVPAQRLLRAGHGQHHADGGEAGEGEAPPVPAALEQDHRLPQQPGHDGQGREPDQHQDDQQQAVGGRLAGGPGDRLAGGGLPAAARRQGGGSGSWGTSRVSAGSWCPAPRAAGGPGWDAEAGCGPAGRSGSRRPRAGRSRRSGSSGHAGAGSRPPAAGPRPCGSARPRPPPAWAAGRRPRRTGRTPASRSGASGSWMAASGTWLLPASRRSSRSDSQRPPCGDAWLQGQAHDPDGMDVGELGDDEGPGPHVQADQPQRLGGGGDPQVARAAGRGRPGRGPPSGPAHRAGSPRRAGPRPAGEPGDSRPSRTRRTSERAAYCWPSQRRAATSRSVMPASVSQRGRRDDPPPGRPGPGAVDVGAGPCAASPKEALLGHVDLRAGDGRRRASW